MRSKLDNDSSIKFSCGNEFQTTSDEDPQWRSDLYSIPLSEPPLRVWTRIDEAHRCLPETIEDVIARHPCIAPSLEHALMEANALATELKTGYNSAAQDQDYLGNVSPQDFHYKLIIQSSDRKLQFIDYYSWDFSWLTDWNPFISSEDSCPFDFKFRHSIRLEDGREQVIQSIPLSTSTSQGDGSK